MVIKVDNVGLFFRCYTIHLQASFYWKSKAVLILKILLEFEDQLERRFLHTEATGKRKKGITEISQKALRDDNGVLRRVNRKCAVIFRKWC